jgi:hypothetical protein
LFIRGFRSRLFGVDYGLFLHHAPRGQDARKSERKQRRERFILPHIAFHSFLHFPIDPAARGGARPTVNNSFGEMCLASTPQHACTEKKMVDHRHLISLLVARGLLSFSSTYRAMVTTECNDVQG